MEPPGTWHPQGPIHPSTRPRATTCRLAPHPVRVSTAPSPGGVVVPRHVVARGGAGWCGALVGARPVSPPSTLIGRPKPIIWRERLLSNIRRSNPTIAWRERTIAWTRSNPAIARPNGAIERYLLRGTIARTG